MDDLWIGEWVMELAGETAVYAYIYEIRMQRQETMLYQQNWMDKWMQYRILRKIGEGLGVGYKSVTFNTEFNVVEPEKLLYNEKENCDQFRALYEAVEMDWRPLVMRVMLIQQDIVQRYGNGG